MAIILRIISADGKKTVTRELPALPAHVKVPAGAKVEVIQKETDVRMTLAQYVNAHASEAGRDGEGSDGTSGVVVETVQDWGDAVAWLDAVEQQPLNAGQSGDMADPSTGTASTSAWYDPGSTRNEGSVLGFDKTTLLIGGLVGGGVAAGAFLLSDDDNPRDDIAPAAPIGLDLAADDDTGTSNSDNITSKTSGLTIAGNAEAGAKVELFDGTASIGTTTAGADGRFTMDLDFAEGVHLITAIATDAAGNVSGRSQELGILVDTTAPAAPAGLDLATDDDTGVSNSDNLTNRTTGLTITGTAEAGARVELFADGKSVGVATAGSNGTFSRDIALAEGAHSITAKATDAAGNVSEASEAITITVDATAPLAPTGLDLDPADDDGVSNSDNITSQTSDLTISGMAEAGSTIEILDGSEIIATATVGSNGLFVVDVDLDLGIHQLTARATDAAGNVGPGSATSLDITIVESEGAASTALLSTGLDIGNFIA